MWEEFKFLPVRAKYFQLKLMTNYGSKSFALSQVQFSMKTGSACTDVSHSSGDHTQSWNYQKVPVTASIYDARKKTMQSHLEATITKSQNCNTTTVTCDGHQDMFHVALTNFKSGRDATTGWYEIGIYHDNFFLRKVQGDNRWGTAAQKPFAFGFRGVGDSSEVWVKYDATTGHLWFGYGRCIGENILLDWIDKDKLPINSMEVMGYRHTDVDFVVCPATDGTQGSCKNGATPYMGGSTRPTKTVPITTLATTTPKAYPACVPKYAPDASAGYKGCFANEAENRDNGHVSAEHIITWDACRTRAKVSHKAYFGLEFPQTTLGSGLDYEAHCLLLDEMPPMNKVTDIQCEMEVTIKGHRLGSGNRLAVYATSANDKQDRRSRCVAVNGPTADFAYRSVPPSGYGFYGCKLQAHILASITASDNDSGDEQEDGFYIALVNAKAGRTIPEPGYYVIGIFSNNIFLRRVTGKNKWSRAVQKNFKFGFQGAGSKALIWVKYDASLGRVQVGLSGCMGDNVALDWTDTVNKLPVDSVQVGKTPGVRASFKVCSGTGQPKDCLDVASPSTAITPPPPTPQPTPQPQADESGGYVGCYANQADDRTNGHLDMLTWRACQQRAKEQNKPFFGMEYPQTKQGQGLDFEAQCLLLDAAPSMQRVVDPQCE